MIGIIEITFFIGMLGSIIAGLWDLKTTEIPDEIPALMSAFGLFIWFVYSLKVGSFYPLVLSIIVGTIYLCIGMLFYKTGQWGGGDAVLMASIGYLIPFFPGVFLFPFTFFVNIFIVGIIWTILYAIIVGIRNKKVIQTFMKQMKVEWGKVILLPVFTLILLTFISYYTNFFHWRLLICLFFIVLGFSLFWKFGKIVEQIVFEKTIPVSRLKPGDVLVDSKVWRGLTKEEVEEIKRRKRRVKIKEGVRFGPVFSIALFLTVFYGGILLPIMVI